MDSPYSGSRMLLKLLTIIPMRVEGFSAPCWFLVSLLEISIAFETIRFFTHSFPRKIEAMILFILGAVLLPIGLQMHLPRYLDASFILFISYVNGFYLRSWLEKFNLWKNSLSYQKQIILYTLGFLLFVVMSSVLLYLSKSGVTCGSGFAPYVALGTASGIVWCWCIAQFLSFCPISCCFALIGKCSFAIMAWHLGAFRLFGVLLTIIWQHKTLSDVPAQWAPYADSWYISIIYCILGVLLPILGKLMWDKAFIVLKRNLFVKTI